jgi:hypothetical protein
MARKMRPFTPGTNDNFPMCGSGAKKQFEIIEEPKPKPPKATALFDMPSRGSSFPELVSLTKRLNAVFNRFAWRHLDNKRKSTGEKRLEITMALDRDRFYLTYALPVRGRRAERKRPGVKSAD